MLLPCATHRRLRQNVKLLDETSSDVIALAQAEGDAESGGYRIASVLNTDGAHTAVSKPSRKLAKNATALSVFVDCACKAPAAAVSGEER